mmetsp:Transcript_12778/g.6348  ORF Transcript_12778/g.6348 Transcript_12778/m.6348 type:complete len:98 (-) Transcript_12778:71-364(-)
MAPAIYIGNSYSPIFQAGVFMHLCDLIIATKYYEFIPGNSTLNTLGGEVCNVAKELCGIFIEVIGDFYIEVDNIDRMGVFISHCPSGTSVYNFNHFA